MDTTDEYGSPLSNLPPLAWLSGLSFTNPESVSGAGDTSLSGGTGARGGFLPGMQGGLGLDALTELLQQQRGGGEGVGVGQAGDLLAAISGNIGQGTLAQGGQGYSIAGESAAQQPQRQPTSGYTAGQTSGNTIDPLSLAAKLLGVARQGLGMAERLGATGEPGTATQADFAGSDPQGYGTGLTPPTINANETGGGSISSMLENAMRSAGIVDANAVGGGSVSSMLENALRSMGSAGQLGLGFTPSTNTADAFRTMTPEAQQLFQEFAGPGVSPGADLTRANLSFTNAYQTPGQTGAPNPFSEFSLANMEPQGAEFLPRNASAYTTPGSPQDVEQYFAPGGASAQRILGQETTLPPTNWFGAGQGGLTGVIGLLNAIRGRQAGNLPGTIGGAGQTVGGLAQLLQSSPQLAQSLGLTPGMLGAAGAGAGGIGGLLGILGGIQALQAGDPVGATTGLGGGALSTYQALQMLSQLYPQLGGGTALPTASALGGSALEALSPSLAAALGIGPAAANLAALGTPAVAGALGIAPGVAGTATSAGAASGALAGASAIATPLLGAVAPIIIGKLLDDLAFKPQQASDDLRAARRTQGFAASIPEHIAAYQRAPGLMQQAQVTQDPQEAARLFAEMQQIQDAFQSSGMEAFLTAGGSRVASGRGGIGGMAFSGFPQGPEILQSLSPYMQALDYGRLMAQDKAAAGGVNISNPLTAEYYARSLGGGAFNEAYQPAAMQGSARPGTGDFLKSLGLPIFGQATTGLDPTALASRGTLKALSPWNPAFLNPAPPTYGPEVEEMVWQDVGDGVGGWARTGQMTPGPLLSGGGFTNQDVTNFLNTSIGHDALLGLENEYGLLTAPVSTNDGARRNAALMAQVAGLQPGQLESGLRGLLSQGGWQSNNPFFARQGAPQQAITPEMIQVLLGQMLPQSSAPGALGLMSSMGGPQAQIAQQPIVDEEIRRMLFQQYGLA